MIAVIFEAIPYAEQHHAYLDAAAALRPQLDQMPGFISIERFESLTTQGKLLSLSFWRDEDSVRAWRNLEVHRAVQAAGRERIFADYRLRVAVDYPLADTSKPGIVKFGGLSATVASRRTVRQKSAGTENSMK